MEERQYDVLEPGDHRESAVRRNLLRLLDYASAKIQTVRAYATRPSRIPNGTRIHVRSDHFEEECEGVITKAHYDEGWLYRVDVTSGDRLDAIRHEDGELWVCDFEAHPLTEDDAHHDRSA